MDDHETEREQALVDRCLKRRASPDTSCIDMTFDENHVPGALPDALTRFKRRVMLALLEAQERYDLDEGPAPEQVTDPVNVLNDPDVDWKSVACRMTAYFAAAVESPPTDLPIYVESIRDMCDEVDSLAAMDAHELLADLNARADAGERVDYAAELSFDWTRL